MYSCDVTSFSSATQNINNQGKQRGLFISVHGLRAQPYLKQPCVQIIFVIKEGESSGALKGRLPLLCAYKYKTRMRMNSRKKNNLASL